MKGFTLIETVISIIIIGISFMGLLSIFTAVYKNAVYDETLMVSAMLAGAEMERVRALSFSGTDDENRDSPEAFSGNFSNYKWQVRVDPVPLGIAGDPAKANYKQVEVRVSNNIAGQVSLKTIVSRY
jgi:prepilin-type N-terminal cleavage/methylation domain-containing protein